jgi:hypothetical protein
MTLTNNPLALKVLGIQDRIVDLIKSDAELAEFIKNRVYPNDLHVLNKTQYPAVTVTLVKSPPEGGTTGYAKHRFRFKIRAYSNILNVDKVVYEQVAIAETISSLFLDNFTVDGTCDDSDVADIDYYFLKSKENQQVYLQCVEITLDCFVLVSRFR